MDNVILTNYGKTIYEFLIRDPPKSLTPKNQASVPPGIANPVYEDGDDLEDRKVIQSRKHNAHCDGSGCQVSRKTRQLILGRRYKCLDCDVPNGLDFCETCVLIPGQGVKHDASHRLLELEATECALCRDGKQERHPATGPRGPYWEILAPVTVLRRIAELGKCGHCAMMWTAFMQCPPRDDWPPRDNEVLTIRVGRPWANCFEYGVVRRPSTDGFSQEEPDEDCLHVFPIFPRAAEAPLEVRSYQDNQYASPNIIVKVSPGSDSNEALQLAGNWYKYCRDKHAECSPPVAPTLPTRVLDIEKGNALKRVFLLETNKCPGEYAALSYCWGPGNPVLVTTTGNIYEHLNDGILIDDLPRTIQDAIKITKSLELRYLWANRLCIIQDSAEDWAHEAARMCDVYSNATITLSADASKSGWEGLFLQHQEFSEMPYQALLDRQGNETPLTLLRKHRHTAMIWSNVDSRDQPLNRRAWTFQERLMSRRILHFTTREMMWECNRPSEYECRRSSSAFSSGYLLPAPEDDHQVLYMKWRHIVGAYMTRLLTVETDKLPALNGLALAFQACLPDDKYLAGMRSGNLEADLTWKPPDARQAKRYLEYDDKSRRLGDLQGGDQDLEQVNRDDNSEVLKFIMRRQALEGWRRHDGYVAPTWSWASMRGPTTYLDFFPLYPFKSEIGILEAETQPVPAATGAPSVAGGEHILNHSGEVVAGQITLRGKMVTDLTIVSCMGVSQDGSATYFSFLKDTEGRFHVEFTPNDQTGPMRHPINVRVVLLGTQEVSAREDVHLSGYSTKIKGIEDKNDPMDERLVDVDDERVWNTLINQEMSWVRERGESRLGWTSYLVVCWSMMVRGAFKRLGCFDVVLSSQQKAMKSLFEAHSLHDTITIV
ncbi:heterokaryon incompatibility protein [Colletotrichum plurivorum]|uniref:Heterokaryon incompatibility protein n=1 Tax=Colletotrichum plurivorum TaxID=2175906 RepID=A0A8H6KFE7_9PEZI|nr:heterokaryon incompatibility protein [Colletotrichum plurivorum]